MNKNLLKNIILILLAAVVIICVIKNKPDRATTTFDNSMETTAPSDDFVNFGFTSVEGSVSNGRYVSSDGTLTFILPSGYTAETQANTYYVKAKSGNAITISPGYINAPQENIKYIYGAGMVNGYAVYKNGVFTDVSAEYNTTIATDSLITKQTDEKGQIYYGYNIHRGGGDAPDAFVRMYPIEGSDMWFLVEIYVQAGSVDESVKAYEETYSEFLRDSKQVFDSIIIN